MNLNDRNILIEDLSHYTGLSAAEVEARMNDTQAVPNQWIAEHGHREGTPEEHHRFYTFNWKYLFDLANFASQFRSNLAHADQYMKGKCLDFGCGIGTVAVHMALVPEVTEVHAIDICIITADFLKFRKKKYNLEKLTILDPTDNGVKSRQTHLSLKGPYDLVYARDVLEHCWNRVEVVTELCNHTAKGGVVAEATPIEYIGEADGWENVRKKSYDLWDVFRDRNFRLVEKEWTGGFSLGHTNLWRNENV